MNELSNHDFSPQELANLIGVQSQNVNAILGKVGELSRSVDDMKRYMRNELADVRSDIKDIRDNSEITTQQANTIRRVVHKQVCKLLKLPEKKCDWNENHKEVSIMCSQLFHARCYTEVARMGHLGQPYATTIAQNFTEAINDIEAWTPSNGIEGLKEEAVENFRIKNGLKAKLN